MSAYSDLSILFSELRASIIARDEAKIILGCYQNILDEFPNLTLGDVVYEFRLWLTDRQQEEITQAEDFVAKHYGIRVKK